MTQRIIKFRAWTGKQMTDEIRLESAHGIRLVSSSDLAPHGMSDDEVIIEQFTGLLDRTDREIYEGDIVKWHKAHWDEEDPQDTLHSVSFTRGSFRLSGETEYTIDSWDLEVIGDIHQNSDLLS